MEYEELLEVVEDLEDENNHLRQNLAEEESLRKKYWDELQYRKATKLVFNFELRMLQKENESLRRAYRLLRSPLWLRKLIAWICGAGRYKR